MTRPLLALALTLGVTPLAAQTPAPTPAHFEVASIHPSPDQPPTPGTAGLHITQRQARFSFLSLQDYIGIGYSMRNYQIVGPDWLASTRFEIIATIPEGQAPEQLSAMMRTLLEDRFRMRTHLDSREFSVYALELGPNFTLQPVPDEAAADGAFAVTSTSSPSGVVVDLGQGASLTLGNNRFDAKKVTMAILADTLARFVDRPVVDKSDRPGRFNVTFELPAEDFQAMMIRSAVAAGVSLPAPALRLLETASVAAVPDALKSQGILLQSRKAPLDVLVIDSVEKMPTEN